MLIVPIHATEVVIPASWPVRLIFPTHASEAATPPTDAKPGGETLQFPCNYCHNNHHKITIELHAKHNPSPTTRTAPAQHAPIPVRS
jgi:hypothetical protein